LRPAISQGRAKLSDIRQTKTDAIDSFIIAEVIRFGRFSETALAEPDLIALLRLFHNTVYL